MGGLLLGIAIWIGLMVGGVILAMHSGPAAIFPAMAVLVIFIFGAVWVVSYIFESDWAFRRNNRTKR
jgi:CHASE2 domain-containing sensor protein